MELILYNRKIHTGENLDTVQALGIQGSKITMLGTNETLLQHKNDTTQSLDLHRKSVFSGFNDSHVHLLNCGYSKTMIDLIGVTSIEEIQERSRKYLLENSLEKDAWIFGRGWNQHFSTGEKVFPIRHDLDKISTEHPILFPRTCGHIFVVNFKALQIIGVNKNTPPN